MMGTTLTDAASNPRLESSGRKKLHGAESALGLFQVLNKFTIFNGTL